MFPNQRNKNPLRPRLVHYPLLITTLLLQALRCHVDSRNTHNTDMSQTKQTQQWPLVEMPPQPPLLSGSFPAGVWSVSLHDKQQCFIDVGSTACFAVDAHLSTWMGGRDLTNKLKPKRSASTTFHTIRFSALNYSLILIDVCACACVHATVQSFFFPYTLWVLGIEFKHSGLVAVDTFFSLRHLSSLLQLDFILFYFLSLQFQGVGSQKRNTRRAFAVLVMLWSLREVVIMQLCLLPGRALCCTSVICIL